MLVNPAVKPYELLADFLGPQTNPYTQEEYVLEANHMDELKALDVDEIKQPSDFWLLQQEEDEVLDYRQAVERYQGAKQTVEAGEIIALWTLKDTPNKSFSSLSFELCSP